MAGAVAGVAPDLAVLSGRIANARVLREHHVWDVANALSSGLLERSAGRVRSRFAALLEAGALVDAVLLLTALAEPRRSVSSLAHGGERWICAMRCGNYADHRCEAEHTDLAAALLAALLQSYRDSELRPARLPGGVGREENGRPIPDEL